MSETVIVLQESSVLIGKGKSGQTPKLQETRKIPMEGYGNLIEQWDNVLINYQKSHKGEQIRLVLPAGYSSVRVSRIPYATGKQLNQMAGKVLEEGFRDGIADYGIIDVDKKDGICLCCGGAEKDAMEHIRNICKENGLQISGITVPMEGYLRLLKQKKEYQGKTAVFLFFEENSVTSVLYKKGMYHYSTRSRIFSEPGTMDFGTEIVRNISGIMQFYRGSREEDPITDVYYVGCDQDDFEAAVEELRNMNLQVAPFRLGDDFGMPEKAVEPWLLCIGGLYADKKKSRNLNLWKAAGQEGEQGEKQKELWQHFLVPGIVLGVCVVSIAGVKVLNQVTSSQIQKMEDWIFSDSVQEQYQQATELENKSADILMAERQVTQATKNLDSYPDLTKEMIEEIVDAGGKDITVRIRQMDADTGILEFDAESQKVIDIPGYVVKLQNTGLFSEVNYTGYVYQDDKYSLSLSCTLEGVSTDGERSGEE